MLTCRLDSLRLIRVTGADRASFLQGQLTQDVLAVDSRRSTLFGWATAQGRLLLVGQLFEWRDAFWLTAPADTADALVPRLKKYVVRARVVVEAADAVVSALWGPAAAATVVIGQAALPADPLAVVTAGDCLVTRVGGDPGRVMILGEAAAADHLLSQLATGDGDATDWLLADIRAGIPWIGPQTSETFIPQMVNLDLVGGLSFDKGCYTGQEIVTRTHHLGRVKRRMVRFGCEVTSPPAPGAVIFGPERETGRVVTASAAEDGVELLAVIPLEDLGGALFLDADRGAPLRRLGLPYRVPGLDD